MKNNAAAFQFVRGKRKLEDWNTETSNHLKIDKTVAHKKTIELGEELERLQNVLYAEHKHKILIVLQGMDTAGKDGAIRNVFKVLNPQGVRVANFKAPDQKELDHDYLWRIHQEVPGKGELVIFNRSHYEDVLVTQVHNLVDKKLITKRYGHINDFERMLSDEGTIILKFYLHISKEEQAARLKARLADPQKKWKYNSGDLKERKLWSSYMKAYQKMLTHCHTEKAPWYVIPSDRKWYRNLAISAILVEALQNLKMRFPASGR